MRVPGISYVQGRNDYTDHDALKFGIAIHNTSNDASDEGEASYATRRTDGVSSHFYCDDDSVTQSVDTEDRVGHAGSNTGNNNAIAVEITGANGKSRAWWLANVAWNKLGWVLAYVIKNDPDYRGFQVRRATVAEMKANPRVKAFYGHDDMRLAWGGTTHTDPGPNFPWDRLFQAVNEHLEVDMPLSAEDVAKVAAASAKAVWEHTHVHPTIPGQRQSKGTVMQYMDAVHDAQVAKLLAALQSLGVELGENVDEDAIVVGVLTGLTPEKIAAAIPPQLAQQVADELAARLQA